MHRRNFSPLIPHSTRKYNHLCCILAIGHIFEELQSSPSPEVASRRETTSTTSTSKVEAQRQEQHCSDSALLQNVSPSVVSLAVHGTRYLHSLRSPNCPERGFVPHARHCRTYSHPLVDGRSTGRSDPRSSPQRERAAGNWELRPWEATVPVATSIL